MLKELEISLCLIVKDEEDVLYRCLESVANIVDEIIVVDTGSSDGTKEIAQKFQAKIYDFKWIDDFAAARNYSFSKATKEYILWMDADDYFTNENNQQLLEIKHNTSTDIDVINMIYSLTRNEKGETLVSLRRNRIVKRSKGYQWIGRIHEYLEVYGNIEYSNIYINHGKQKEYTNRNLLVFEKMVLENQSFSPRDTFYYASEIGRAHV